MALKLLLTFDYELFLGKKIGDLSKSLIDPTDKILDILKQNNAKAVFFVDASYLLKMKELKHSHFEIVKQQVKRIYDQGSEVELHLHPHWEDLGEDFSFKSFDKFRLHALPEDEIKALFAKGSQILKECVGDENYSPKAFRAGGWSILPFDKLCKAFEENGITIDSSVLPGFCKEELPHHYYDFKSVSADTEFWSFTKDPREVEDNGKFKEYPVSVVEISGIDLLVNKLILKIKKEKIFGDGQGLYSPGSSSGNFKRIFQKNLRKISIEGTSLFLLKKLLKAKKNNELVNMVMHPKSLSEVSLSNLEYLVKNYTTVGFGDI